MMPTELRWNIGGRASPRPMLLDFALKLAGERSGFGIQDLDG